MVTSVGHHSQSVGTLDTIRTVGFDSHRLLLAADFASLRPHETFEAFTVPEILTRWWPSVAEVDPREGGSYHLSWPKEQWSLRGTYSGVSAPPPRPDEAADVIPVADDRASGSATPRGGGALAFLGKWDHETDAPPRDVAIRIGPMGQGTRMRLEHGTYGESDDELEVRKGHEEGWRHFLGQLSGLKS
jgi:uncharacterized protein YndB with AHSA1/START domain